MNKLLSDISTRLDNFGTIEKINTSVDDTTSTIPMLSTEYGNIHVITMLNYFSTDRRYGLNIPSLNNEILKNKKVLDDNIIGGKFMLSKILKFDNVANINISIKKIENAYHFLISMLTYITNDSKFILEDVMIKYHILNGIRQYTRIFLESTVNLIKKYGAINETIINIHHDLIILYKILTQYGVNLGLSYDELIKVYSELNTAFDANMKIYSEIIQNNMVELIDPTTINDLYTTIADLKNRIEMLHKQHEMLLSNKEKLSNSISADNIKNIADVNLKTIIMKLTS